MNKQKLSQEDFSNWKIGRHIDKMEITHWDGLSRFGRNKLFKSSYYWLILVPIIVRFLERIESPIKFVFAQAKLEFNVSLPFSWKLFYIGAIFVSIGNIIYEFVCPAINKKFSNFSEFKNKGYTYSYLLQFRGDLDSHLADRLSKVDFYFLTSNSELLKENEASTTVEVFWNLFNNSKIKKREARICCTISYLIGLAIIALVLVQNIFFVLEAIF